MEGNDLRSPQDFVATLESREQAERMMTTLTEKQRQVVQMYFFQGLSQREIAGVMRIQKQVVSRHIQAAMEKLKTILSFF